MCLGLGTEIIKIDVAVLGGFDRNDLPSDHLRAGGVGAMRTHRDKTDIAMPLPVRAMPGRNGQKPGIFALRAGIGLHRHGVISGDLAQLVTEVLDQFLVPLGLVRRHKGMKARKLAPADRHHFGRGVQFHRAASQRDHGAVQRKITVGKTAHVAHHLGLGPVHVKDRVGQVIGQAQQPVGDAVFRCQVVIGRGDPEGAPDRLDIGRAGRLVQRDADARIAHGAQVDPLVHRGFQNRRLQGAHIRRDRVEKRLGLQPEPRRFEPAGQAHGLAVNTLRDGLEALRPMKYRVHRGHDGQKGLRRADVAGGLLAADMLFAGLQRQSVGAVAVAVDTDTHDATGHGALVGLAAGHVGRVRAAIPHRHAEALRATHGDIGTHRAGFLEQGQCQRISRDDADGLRRVQTLDMPGDIAQMPVGPRILEKRAKDLRGVHVVGIADDHLDAERCGARPDHRDILRMTRLIDEERALFRLGHALCHGHRLGTGGGLVQQGGIGDVETGQIANHGLEIQQRLEPTLADLGLVGRIGGVPGRVFQDVALDRRRRDSAMIALPDQACQNLVLGRDHPHVMHELAFGLGLAEGQRSRLPNGCRHGLLDQVIKTVDAKRAQHVGHFLWRRADMAAVGEIIWQVVGGRKRHVLLLVLCPASMPARSVTRPGAKNLFKIFGKILSKNFRPSLSVSR